MAPDLTDLLVVHDDEKLETRIFPTEVDEGRRFPCSGEGNNFDDVIALCDERKTRDSGEIKKLYERISPTYFLFSCKLS